MAVLKASDDELIGDAERLVALRNANAEELHRLLERRANLARLHIEDGNDDLSLRMRERVVAMVAEMSALRERYSLSERGWV